MSEHRKKIGQMIARAWSDPAFKQKLKEHPESAFQEAGVKVPSGVKIVVHEDSETVMNFSLPVPVKLGDQDLDAVAGGLCGICYD